MFDAEIVFSCRGCLADDRQAGLCHVLASASVITSDQPSDQPALDCSLGLLVSRGGGGGGGVSGIA